MANVSQMIQPLRERVFAIIASPESWPAQRRAEWVRRGLALEPVFSPLRALLRERQVPRLEQVLLLEPAQRQQV